MKQMTVAELAEKAWHFDGNGYLEIPHHDSLNGDQGLTLRPRPRQTDRGVFAAICRNC